MKCEKCGVADANLLYTETVNGQSRTLHLCSGCAKSLGIAVEGKPFSSLFGGYPDLFSDFFGLSSNQTQKSGKTCTDCGSSFAEIKKSGKVGCPACYAAFGEELAESIRAIHGNATHTGRAPLAKRAAMEKETRLATLKKALRDAIASEDFEKAATLRDEIRAVEKA